MGGPVQWIGQYHHTGSLLGAVLPRRPRERAATYNYPKPLSVKFWQLYAEPVNAFLSGALYLRFALWCLSGRRHLKTTKNSRDSVEEGTRFIQRVVAPVSPTVELSEDGALHQKWSPPSLLGSLAMMALQDLVSDRLHFCTTCRRFFTSGAYQVLYCSERCRKTEQQRRYREKKAKPKMAAQGKKATKKRSATPRRRKQI